MRFTFVMWHNYESSGLNHIVEAASPEAAVELIKSLYGLRSTDDDAWQIQIFPAVEPLLVVEHKGANTR